MDLKYTVTSVEWIYLAWGGGNETSGFQNAGNFFTS